ncbi:MAG: metallophosphoesterase, partial [Prolixibacteraceae bacterium]|nr:metallophosphoesterase [Prolixibacteraceae bacterium]
MKRRKFIQNLGMSVPPLLLQPHSNARGEKMAIPEYNYQQPRSLQEAVTREGQIIIRLEFQSGERDAVTLRPEIRIRNGHILRSKDYFFERGEDNFTGDIDGLTFLLAESDTDVMVLWLDRFLGETALTLADKEGTLSFTLTDMVEKTEVAGKIGKTNIKANFLLDHEIGELNPEEVGIKSRGDDFSFLLMADPQGGDATLPNANLRMKVHNAFVEEGIKLANNLKTNPLFCLMVGDIVDEQGEAEHFVQMAKFFEKLNMPVLYGMGNHESRYKTEFWPGYNLSGFNNYFAAQKALNGMEKLLYSFNLGKWHFVVWPDPLRSMFWENHPHYFDWLERDLEKYKNRPT